MVPRCRGLAVLLTLACPAVLPAQTAWPVHTGTTAEFRSLHAAADGAVWAGGSGGVVLRATDGGRTVAVDTVADAVDLFMVGVWAADGTRAHLLGTSFEGGVARVYRTRDGGRTWERRYEDRRPGVFMDALACWDVSRCVAFGDPVDGSFVVARTTDGGDSWSRVAAGALPPPLPGEAGFAASGRALVTGPDGVAWFGTGGGDRARVYRTDDHGATWSVHDTPLPAGPTAGIFALAFAEDGRTGIAVGGDYQKRTEAHPTLLVTADGGRSWRMADASVLPAGVRYGAASGRAGTAPFWLATGPSGLGHSADGRAWHPLTGTSLNTVFVSGTTAWAAGPDGALVRFDIPPPG